ncbi:MAG: hypothetical protein K1X89_26690 [Myxococcaceae bacterium]|nr:hypothetical protein [Myxococcaceae bacterium]
MAAIGIFSDTGGDLEAFDAALKVLAEKGARRFLFAGGRFQDLDDWVQWKRDLAKAQSDYTDLDFLADVENHLAEREPLERPLAFGTAYELMRGAEETARLADRVIRTPEKGSLAYQDPKIPKKAVDMLGETLCCLVHDKNDLDKEDMLNAVLLVHGRESVPKVVQIGPRYFLTPGSVAKGTPAAVGLLELATEDKSMRYSAYALDGKALVEPQVLQVVQKKKLSVKG